MQYYVSWQYTTPVALGVLSVERHHPEDMSQGGRTRSLRLWPNSVFNVFFRLLVPVWLTSLGSLGGSKGTERCPGRFRLCSLPV